MLKEAYFVTDQEAVVKRVEQLRIFRQFIGRGDKKEEGRGFLYPSVKKNTRSFKIDKSELRIALFALKISSRKAKEAHGK